MSIRLCRGGLVLRAALVAPLLAGCTPRGGSLPAAQQAEAPAKPHREPPLKAAVLYDRDTTYVEATLGPPELRKPEGRGEVWLYASPEGCSLDVAFQPTRGTQRVVSTTTQTPNGLSEAACLRLVAEQG